MQISAVSSRLFFTQYVNIYFISLENNSILPTRCDKVFTSGSHDIVYMQCIEEAMPELTEKHMNFIINICHVCDT